MNNVTQPKVFISYAHDDGESAVKDFWANLRGRLRLPGREWEKWDDREILVGQDWHATISQALEKGCNCCLLLLSDLFGKSSYILDEEWPKTLARYQEQGIVFFPVVFGVLEGGLAALPESIRQFQVYWPTVAELYSPPPLNVTNPDKTLQCYLDAKEVDAPRGRFLSHLARQMNARFDEYLREQAAKALPPAPAAAPFNSGQFVTNDSDEETFAKAVFGAFSYERRYRDSNSRGYYFPRQIDAKLDERLVKRNWVLVEGHPLAGKTRAVFEAVRRLMLAGSVALWPFKPPEQTDQPLAAPAFPAADYRIVWMDDIDTRLLDLAKRGYGANEITRFLENLAEAGIILAATTRTGPAYYDFRHRFDLDEHLWDKLESLPIHRLEGEEETIFTAWYFENFGAVLPDKFDHHPGSLFLNLEAMSKRWLNMDDIIRLHKLRISAERAKDIMRALHVFYVMEAHRPGGLFLEEDVRFYVRHKAEKRRMSTPMGLAFSKAQLLNDLPGGEEWETLIRFLSQDQFHLGFLRQEGKYLRTETAYLDYIVAPDGEKNIVQTVVENFSEEERLKLGLIVTSYNFGEAFQQSPPKTEKELEKLVRKLKPLGLERDLKVWNQLLYLCQSLPLMRRALEMLTKAGLRPDVVTYTTLVARAEGYAEARAVIDEMRAAGVYPNVFTYNTLIAKAEDFAAARAVVDEMRAAGMRLDVVTYNTLIRKAENHAAARPLLEEMRAAGIRPDAFTCNTLVAKAEGYAAARAVIEEMRAAGVVPDVSTYNALVAKAADYEGARAVFGEMTDAGLRPGGGTYNALVAKAEDFATARAVADEMLAAGIRLDSSTCITLIGKAEDFAAARAVVEEMRAAGVDPDVNIYNKLIGRAGDYAAARAVVEEMKAAGLAPDTSTLNALASKVESYAATRAVIEEMSAAGVSPNVSTFNMLITRAEDYATARAVLDEMRAAGGTPGLSTFNALVSKAEDYAGARAVVAEMRAAGMRPNLLTYSWLIGKAEGYSAARPIIDEMRAAGVNPNVSIYFRLAAKAEDDADARAFLDELSAAGVRPSAGIFNMLIGKAAGHAAARAIMGEMRAAGVNPNVSTYNTLIGRAEDYAAARALLEEMNAAGVVPDASTFQLLSVKAEC